MNTGLARRRKPRRLKSEINVVPYIDVMLVLLVIFMVTAPLLTLNFEVELPKSSAAAPLDSGSTQNIPVIVAVLADGRLTLKLPEANTPEFMDKATLQTHLAALAIQNPDLRVIVAAEGTGTYQNVISTLDVIRNAGIEKVGLPSQ